MRFLQNYKIGNNNFIAMYMSSGTRPYPITHTLLYDELPFCSTKNGFPLGKHKRMRTEQYDRESVLKKELWELERKDL